MMFLRNLWNEEHIMERFWEDETGLDLVEYAMILAFVVVATLAIYLEGTGDQSHAPAPALAGGK
jgi:Flp pilus assembly pilin Flp